MQFTYEEFHYKMTLLLKCDTCFKIIASVKVRLTRDSFFFQDLCLQSGDRLCEICHGKFHTSVFFTSCK